MTLPIPHPAFRWSAEPWGHALRCRPLEQVAQHLFTTKQLELRPSTFRPFERLEALEGRPSGLEERTRASSCAPSELAWMQATASLGAGLEQLMRVKQVHGRTVRVVRRGEITPRAVKERPDADALVSNAPDLVLAVQVADCVPVLMADPHRRAAGAVHAGWRGTCARVAEAAIEAMAREFDTDPQDLMVAIGPSIGACCYEVGAELLDAFGTAGATEDQLAQWFRRDERGTLRLDLAVANRDQIRAAGVPADRIFVAGLCTETHSEIFDSFRAAGERAGRMAGLIRVPAAPG